MQIGAAHARRLNAHDGVVGGNQLGDWTLLDPQLAWGLEGDRTHRPLVWRLLTADGNETPVKMTSPVPANPAGLVYGTIAVGALLAAESARRETYLRTVGAVAITMLLYWLAHSYAEFTARRLREHGRFTFDGLARTAAHELSVLAGAALPLLMVLSLWVTGARLSVAVTAAIWTSASVIVAIEAVIGIRADLARADLVRQTVMGALLGLLVIALRLVLH